MAFADLLNQEASALEADGVDVDPVRRARVQRLHGGRQRLGPRGARSARPTGLKCTTAVHICYGYGIKANIDWKKTPRRGVAAVRGDLPGDREEPIDQVSLECAHSHVPMDLHRACSTARRCMVGVIDVASDVVETPDRSPTRSAARCSSSRASGSCRAPTAAWRRWTGTSRCASSKHSRRALRSRDSATAERRVMAPTARASSPRCNRRESHAAVPRPGAARGSHAR